MTHPNPLPVIFVVFADPMNDLNWIKEERKQIRTTLSKAEKAGLCTFIERSNEDFDEIANVLQDSSLSGRIAIFHYAGHAESMVMMLNKAGIDAKHFNQMLAALHSLKLVFLNACLTLDQAEDLAKAGIPNVIATSHKIVDEYAPVFASRFYNGLIEGRSVEGAFEDADNFMSSQYTPEQLLEIDYSKPGAFEEPVPWIYKAITPDAADWKLSDELDNPYFGLPVPDRTFLPAEPFIYLRPYTEKESLIFFGRGADIRDLFFKLSDPKGDALILLCGQSGVGKSSLLDAGLIPRLKKICNVIYLTRDPLLGLSGSLARSMQCPGHPERILRQWKVQEATKPLIVIVDQVEEAFTKPNANLKNELAEFFKLIATIFDSPQSAPAGKLLLAYRKEFHAEIETQSKKHQLPFTTCFLQALKKDNIVEIVEGVTLTNATQQKYKLQIEQDLANAIADDLTEDVQSPIAPILQILLSKMWQQCKPGADGTREFTRDYYHKFKKEGIGLVDFVKESISKISEWDASVVKSGLLYDLLYFFTTSLSTAASHKLSAVYERYGDEPLINDLITRCKDLFLLSDYRSNDVAVISLSHDTLAPVIRTIYDQSILPGQLAQRILKNQEIYLINGNEIVPLNERDLATVEAGQKGMRKWNAKEVELVEKSRQQRESNLKQRQRQATLARRLRIGAGIAASIMLLLGVISIFQFYRAKDEARKAKALYLSSEAVALKSTDPTQALKLLGAANSLYPGNTTVLQNTYSVYKDCERLPFYSKSFPSNVYGPDIKLSPDHQYMLEVENLEDKNDKKSVFLRDINGATVCELTYKDCDLEKTDFLPGGKRIAALFSNSGDDAQDSLPNILLVSDYEGKNIDTLRFANSIVDGFTFSKDERYLITSEEDYEEEKSYIFVKDALTGKELKRFPVGEGVDDFVWHPRDNKLLFSTYDSVGCLDLDKGTRISKLLDGCHTVTFSPDGNYFVGSSTTEEKAVLWDITGKYVATLPHTSYVWSTSFSNDGRLIATSSWDDTVKLWTANGTLLKKINNTVRTWYSQFTSDGKRLITISHDNGVRLWDTAGNLLATYENRQPVRNAYLVDNDKKIITAVTGQIRTWNIDPGIKRLDKAYWAFYRDSFLVRWDYLSKELRILNEKQEVLFQRYFSKPVLTVNELKSGFVVATGTQKDPFRDRDNDITETADIYFFDEYNQQVSSFNIQGYAVTDMETDEKRKRLLAVCTDGKARMLDYKGNVLSVFSNHYIVNAFTDNSYLQGKYHERFSLDETYDALFSITGDTVITITGIGYVFLWDSKGSIIKRYDSFIDPRKRPKGHSTSSSTKTMAISPLGTKIAIFTAESHFFVFDLKKNRTDTFNYTKESNINAVIYHGGFLDNKYVVSENSQGVVIWSMASRQNIAELGNYVSGCSLCRKGKRLIVHERSAAAGIYLAPASLFNWINHPGFPPLSPQLKQKYQL